MAKLKKIRITLAVKLLLMFLTVLIVANISFGKVAYTQASDGMTKSVYSQIDTVSSDVVNQIKSINDRHFQMLHALAEITALKDEKLSLAEK